MGPRFRGDERRKQKKSRRCLAGGFLWTAARVGETALASVQPSLAKREKVARHPAYAHCVSFGGFESAEARSAKAEA